MSASFLDDVDAVDPNAVEVTGPAYPVAQWLHGDPKLAAAGGVTHTGGLIMPTKYVDDNVTPPPGWVRTTVAFSSGKSEQVFASPKPRLAVIRTRFRWFVVYNGVTTYSPRSAYVENCGMRGHVQALCGVSGFDFPVVVTFKGKASQEFERLLREFSQKTGEAAHRLLREKAPGTRFPRYAFWMRLAPAPHVKVGQKGQESIVTPPVLELPAVLTEDYLGKVYVGRERLVAYQAVYLEAAEWGSAWDKAGAEASADLGDGEHEIDEQTGEITRANPKNAVDDMPEHKRLAEVVYGDEPLPKPGKVALNVTGARWLGLIRDLAKRYPSYADKRGQPVNAHILNAAAAEGFAEINNGNMEAVIEALAERAAAKAN